MRDRLSDIERAQSRQHRDLRFELSCPLRGRARAHEKGAMIVGVARDADLLALVAVSLF